MAVSEMPGGSMSGEKPPVMVAISSDGMSATISLGRSEEGYTEDEVRRALEAAGVVFGIDWSRVSVMLAQRLAGEGLVVANGTPPEPSVDATIEYLFDSGAGTLQEHAGRVDWRELNLVHSVEAGTPVAQKHPPQLGQPGTTVRGQAIQSKPPKDMRIALGTGVALAEDDPNMVVSTVAGAVRVDVSGKVTVDNTYVVKGDVDLASGNVDFVGSVVIQGDIKKGFLVKATGDIEVKGVIEEATLIAGGSVIVQGGILGGSGTTPLQAGQDILAKFANNAMLHAGHDIVLGQEALNCDMEAERKVIVGGKTPNKGAIMGGSVRAAEEIVVFNVGSGGGVKTKLRAGYDWLLPKKLRSVETEMQERKAQLEKLQTGMQLLQERRAKGELDAEHSAMLEKLRLAEESDRMSLKALENRRNAWLKVASAPSSISVYGTVRAGSELIVDGKARALVEDRERERFVTEGGVVIGVALKS